MNIYENPAEYSALWAEMNAEQGHGDAIGPPCLLRCPAL